MKRLKLSRDEKMIAGVCGGFARYIGLDPTLVRLIWALLFLLGHGVPIVIYLICWAVMPLDNS